MAGAAQMEQSLQVAHLRYGAAATPAAQYSTVVAPAAAVET